MSDDENTITVLDLTEDETNNILDLNYSRSDIHESVTPSSPRPDTSNDTDSIEESINLTIDDDYDPDMSPAVIGFILAQIVRNFQKVLTKHENTSNINLLHQFAESFEALLMANERYSKLLSMLSDKDKIDIQKVIERQERVFMKKHKEILAAKDELYRTQELLAVHTAKIDCKKELMECTICYNEEKDTVLIPCSHTFCRDCVQQMMAHGGKCAVCRGKFKTYCKVRLTT